MEGTFYPTPMSCHSLRPPSQERVALPLPSLASSFTLSRERLKRSPRQRARAAYAELELARPEAVGKLLEDSILKLF